MAEPIWSQLATDLLLELRISRGRIALLTGSGSRDTLLSWAQLVGENAMLVGRQLTENGRPVPNVQDALANSIFLTDIDILFWPALALNPIQLLHILARNGPRVAVWPGAIAGRRATYSSPGRRDYFEGILKDTLVLRTLPVDFPDQVPFSIERIPA